MKCNKVYQTVASAATARRHLHSPWRWRQFFG